MTIVRQRKTMRIRQVDDRGAVEVAWSSRRASGARVDDDGRLADVLAAACAARYVGKKPTTGTITLIVPVVLAMSKWAGV